MKKLITRKWSVCVIVRKHAININFAVFPLFLQKIESNFFYRKAYSIRYYPINHIYRSENGKVSYVCKNSPDENILMPSQCFTINGTRVNHICID